MLLCLGWLVWSFLVSVSSNNISAITACAQEFTGQSERINCWYRLIEKEIIKDGVPAGMHAFTYIYDNYPDFVSTGCHVHAHKVGDMVYYGVYLADPRLEALEYPDSLTACGYGFFHGFLEHLIQDHPTTKFVTETCEWMSERLEERMPAIRTICYHGSGHGFTLAQVEKVPQAQWGDLIAFTKDPLEKCDALSVPREIEREECREGVFNVLINWAEGGEYGFSFNRDNPLVICDAFEKKWRHACYYEFSQKLDHIARRDVMELWRVANKIKDRDEASVVFRVAMAGAVQQTIADGTYIGLTKKCLLAGPQVENMCIESIVNGLFEHGSPRKEHDKALAFCMEEWLNDAQRTQCYTAVATRLLRFHTREDADDDCRDFPKEYQSMCLRARP